MPRERFARQALGPNLQSRIRNSRTLLVGAGGIGCELLKNLVLSGFGEIHVVDLDTIDLSNLNRQFLFRQEHIKRPKALVAKESAKKFNPHVKIEAHHANIRDDTFNVTWFQSFDIVFNALDNLDARRHVNRMCLAANVPLVESGTTGFNGQVQVIKRARSECYECNPKDTPKTFPVCTIRSTPSQPIHCIVWAKSYLFAEVFGTSEDDSPELNNTETSENAAEIETLRQEAQALKRIRQAMGSEDFPRQVFEKVFKDDIERLRSMEAMWRTRKKPNVLDFDELTTQIATISDDVAVQDQKIWSIAENFAVFVKSLKSLSNRLEEIRANGDVGNAAPVLSFDKDDKDILDFVTAAANLRSLAFEIETKSKFEIKRMAGNIIPAIATTNAMAAGICVLQAFRVFRDDYDKARLVFLAKSTDRVISSEPLHSPRPDCPVCSVTHATMEVDLSRATLQNLVHDILQKQLGYGDELSVSSEIGILFDPELEENLTKLLSDLNIKQGSFITVVDEQDEDTRVDLLFIVSAEDLEPDSAPIMVPETIQTVRKPKTSSEVMTNGTTANHEINETSNGTKRKRSTDEALQENDIIAKRGKVFPPVKMNGQPEDLVLVDGNGEAAILIDD